MVEMRILKQLIAEYQKFVEEVRFMPRDIAVDMSRCNVFIGVRRCGKSFLMYQCIHQLFERGVKPTEILFMNFEDDRLPPLDLSGLEKLKKAYEEMYDSKPIFFLDEIQNVTGWEKFARRLADTGYQVFVTGSNAKMLSSEIAGKLGGRYNMTEVYPYSFREFLKSRGKELPSNWEYLSESGLKREFDEYLLNGGLPEQIKTEHFFKRQWISGLFDRIYLGDIVARHAVRKPAGVRMLIRKIAESVGQPITASRIASIVTEAGEKIKPETASEYIGYAQEAWLMLDFEDYAAKLVEKMSVKKYYMIDNSLITLFKDGAYGQLLENLVAITLKKRYGKGVGYYKHNIEVDFFVPDKKEAIQVSYEIDNASTLARELDALQALNQRVPLERAILITHSEEREAVLPCGLRVEILPAWKWLLRN